jgi:hypothetical protein
MVLALYGLYVMVPETTTDDGAQSEQTPVKCDEFAHPHAVQTAHEIADRHACQKVSVIGSGMNVTFYGVEPEHVDVPDGYEVSGSRRNYSDFLAEKVAVVTFQREWEADR